MKVKTLRKFIDKEANAVREVGSVFECNKKRFEEIQNAGNFVAEVKEEKKKEEVKSED